MPFLLEPTNASALTARSHEVTRKPMQLLPRLCCTLGRFPAVLFEESLRPFDAPAQNRRAVDPVNNSQGTTSPERKRCRTRTWRQPGQISFSLAHRLKHL